MADVNQSLACVNYHQSVPATIARQQIFLQFSSNPDMKIEKVCPNHVHQIYELLATSATHG